MDAVRMLRGALVALLVTTLVPATLEAQRPPEPAADRGWIGISYELQSRPGQGGATVLITDVSPGSPAEEAGVRPGDRLLAVNELSGPEALGALPERLRLRAGDRVVMELERGGERREVRLRAGVRPADFGMPTRVEVLVSGDDRVETWVRSMDSLRSELVHEVERGVRVSADAPRPDRTRRLLIQRSEERSARAPFEFFVFRGESYDSLRREMLEVNRRATELEARLEARGAEIRRRTRSSDPARLAQDEEFQRLSERLDEVSRRAAEVSRAMAEEARAEAELEYGFRRPRIAGPPMPEPAGEPREPAATLPPEPAEFRPLTPYLLGRNRVAGAEVVDLKPELAAYFSVDAGVLVVDVAPGTPAGLAGLQPGDVIVRLDQVRVRSVEDLRFGVSMAGDSVPVSLVRRGESTQLLLRR